MLGALGAPVTWLKTGSGNDYLVTPEGFAYLHPWANPGFTTGVVYCRDGRVEVIPLQDHHQPFEGVKYARSSERAKAVCESLLRASGTPSPTRTVWDRLGED